MNLLMILIARIEFCEKNVLYTGHRDENILFNILFTSILQFLCISFLGNYSFPLG